MTTQINKQKAIVKAQTAFGKAVEKYRKNFLTTNKEDKVTMMAELQEQKDLCMLNLSDADMALADAQSWIDGVMGSIILKQAVNAPKAKAPTKDPKAPKTSAVTPVSAKETPKLEETETKTPEEKKVIEIAHKSTAESPVQLVWRLAREMKGARRKDVIAAAVEKGVAHNTARTQYQSWFKAEKNA